MNEMVTIPREEYDRLQAAAEDLADLQSYDRAKAALAAGEEELVPLDFVNRMLNGENALRVYRDLRGLTQAALAEKAGVNRVTVTEIEIGRKQGSVATLRALAHALDVTLDDLAELDDDLARGLRMLLAFEPPEDVRETFCRTLVDADPLAPAVARQAAVYRSGVARMTRRYVDEVSKWR